MLGKATTALVAVITAGAAASGSEAVTTAKPSASAGRGTAVSLTEFKFGPQKLSATAGRWRVTVRNTGDEPHEFVLIRTKRAAGALPMKGKVASEKGAVGEIPEQEPGERASRTFKLKPGRYVFICNVPGHYKSGMRGTLRVR